MSEIEADEMALVREFERLFGDDHEDGKHLVLLPLVDSGDALAFFRTVPTGTPFDQLLPLAVAYRAAHPVDVGMLQSADPGAAH